MEKIVANLLMADERKQELHFSGAIGPWITTSQDQTTFGKFQCGCANRIKALCFCLRLYTEGKSKCQRFSCTALFCWRCLDRFHLGQTNLFHQRRMIQLCLRHSPRISRFNVELRPDKITMWASSQESNHGTVQQSAFTH